MKARGHLIAERKVPACRTVDFVGGEMASRLIEPSEVKKDVGIAISPQW
jgi:hypothetical protein